MANYNTLNNYVLNLVNKITIYQPARLNAKPKAAINVEVEMECFTKLK